MPSEEILAQKPDVIHTLVHTHPTTGANIFYLDPSTMVGIEGGEPSSLVYVPPSQPLTLTHQRLPNPTRPNGFPLFVLPRFTQASGVAAGALRD